MSGDYFGCVFVISFDVTWVFVETAPKSPPCFANAYLLHKMRDAIDNICGGECKAISGFNRWLGSCYFVPIAIETRQLSAPEFNYNLTINPALLNTRADDATLTLRWPGAGKIAVDSNFCEIKRFLV